MKINLCDLHKHVLGDDVNADVIMNTQESAYHGSSYEILKIWDPGPSYVIRRQWNPGGPSSTSATSFILIPSTLGTQKWSLDHYLWLAPSLHTFLVALAPSLHIFLVALAMYQFLSTA